MSIKPLAGLTIVEMAGIGPAPFCGMMLADHGARVIRVVRPGHRSPLPVSEPFDVLNRGRETVELNVRTEEGRSALWDLLAAADGLIEGFRPGVMERLGLGPASVLSRHPHMVYGRMTGWGQSGPMAAMAGHDMNYAGLTGAIHAIGDADRPPPPPLNLIADFGGGGMMLAFGMVGGLLAAGRTGRGCVVDAAMSDGTALLMGLIQGLHGAGQWSSRRGANVLDGGAPFYATYRCADGRFVAVCPLEPPFFAVFLERLGLTDDADFARQYDQATWPRMRERLSALFQTRPRDAWAALFDGSDACVTPVLTLEEAPAHPHNRARETYRARAGALQPAPAPRFSEVETASPTSSKQEETHVV